MTHDPDRCSIRRRRAGAGLGTGSIGHQYAPPVPRSRSDGHSPAWPDAARTCAAALGNRPRRRPRCCERRSDRRRHVRAGRRPVPRVRPARLERRRTATLRRDAPGTGSSIPWFGWLFALPVRWTLRRAPRHRPRPPAGPATTPWWAPPDRLDARQTRSCSACSPRPRCRRRSSTRCSRRRVKFAADDFGVGDSGVGVAGSLVRAGIVLALPAAVLADRDRRRRVDHGRRRGGPDRRPPLGALAPTFPVLVATPGASAARSGWPSTSSSPSSPPRRCRATAGPTPSACWRMASGLGAGVAVMALPLADLGESAWRLVYLVALIWLVVAVDIARRLPETTRFERPHVVAPPLDRRRFAALALVALPPTSSSPRRACSRTATCKDARGFSAAHDRRVHARRPPRRPGSA